MYLVFDIGSSSIRCSAIKDKNLLICKRSELRFDANGFGDVESIVSKCEDCLVGVCTELGRIGCEKVSGVAFTGFVTNCFLVEEQNLKVVSKLHSYASKVSDKALNFFGKPKFRSNTIFNTGVYYDHESFLPVKLLDLKQVFLDTSQKLVLMTISSYLIRKWSAIWKFNSISLSEGSWTGMVNVGEQEPKWNRDLLQKFELHESVFPKICTDVDSGCSFSQQWTEQFPLLKGTKIFLGIGDGFAANVGGNGTFDIETGVLNLCLTIGTSAAARTLVPVSYLNQLGISVDQIVRKGLFLYRVTEQDALIGGALTDAGSLYDWWKNLFTMGCTSEHLKEMELKARGIKFGSTGIRVVPYLNGERSPEWNSSSKLSLSGLTLGNSKPELILRAVFESVALELKKIVGLLQETLNARKIIFNINGGSYNSSLLWQEILSTVLSRLGEIHELSSDSGIEITSLGAFLLVQE
eukprot:snap_masked-scaffold_4-processed-gene-9.3-mRNA-1 protein AED:1.00 eAED:1.00 QI:0/-1/0/0/-1/1/1/0/465